MDSSSWIKWNVIPQGTNVAEELSELAAHGPGRERG